MNPVVSIIITCFNLEKFIAEAIHSLLDQDFSKDYEIIVVNDASADNSASVISSIKDERIRFIDLPVNGGARNAVELAFSLAKGEYICRFDGDDRWPGNYLGKVTEILENNPEVSMVYGDCTIIDTDGNVLSFNNNIKRKNKQNPILEFEFIDILLNYYINAPTIMFRREAFAKAFPLPASFTNFIDWYISLKVLESGKAYYIDEPIAFYRLHTTNMHRQMIVNKLGEQTTKYILDLFVVKNNNLTKQQKKKLLAVNYFHLAERYFGVRAFPDARRNYLLALRFNQLLLKNKDWLKHFLGTLIGSKTYSIVRSIAAAPLTAKVSS
jgi:glycosyltransferase involved in cell wall biosynthesis